MSKTEEFNGERGTRMRCLQHLRGAIAIAAIVFASSCGRHEAEHARYLPLSEVEASVGPLISAGNHPTPYQHGTGERVGLFRDANGNVWGLPLIEAETGAVLACAPPDLRAERATDTYPAGAVIIGSTNEPTGWRDGTGTLEILLRDASGAVRRQSVRGGVFAGRAACWTPEFPGPPQQLSYYRLVPRAVGIHEARRVGAASGEMPGPKVN
jgi:hypothetical protein